ncbi:MAG: cyclase/dehydrase, partial [Acidobacteria bacterium]
MARYAHEDRNGEQLAIGLGWFSIALGLAEVAAPGRVARLIGLPEDATTRSTLRGLGAREIANGIAILSEPDNSKWVWARVGGDVMDLSLL